MTVLVLVAAAGGFGAVARYALDTLLRARSGSDLPVGIAVVNLTGSLLLGLVTGLALARLLTSPGQLVLGTGFLGGYTTFSTATLDTVRLLQQGRHLAAVGNGVGLLLGTVVLAAGGLWLGLRF